MLAIQSDNALGSPPQTGIASLVAGLDPGGLARLLNLDGNGLLQVLSVGAATAANQAALLASQATAANQATELARLLAILNTPINQLALGAKPAAGSLPVALATDQAFTLTTDLAAAVRAAAAQVFTAATGLVAVSAANNVGQQVASTTPVPIALFGLPNSATRTVTLDERRLVSTVAGVFTVWRDVAVSGSAGGAAVASLVQNTGSAAAPQATLGQGPGTGVAANPLTVSGGKVEATIAVGSVGTDRQATLGRQVLTPGHNLYVTFLPLATMAYAAGAGAAFDWREVGT